MNQLDFNIGRSIESRRSAEQEQVDDEAIAKWQSLSNRLQARLSEVQKDSIHCEAMLAARDAQQRALRDVLSQIAPNHPVLMQIREIGEAAQAASYRAKGYELDPATKSVRKSI